MHVKETGLTEISPLFIGDNMKALKNIIVGALVITIAVVVTFILRINFFKFDKEMTKKQKEIIEKSILDSSKSYLEEGMTFMSTHYFGNRFNDDKLEVYLWVRFSEYDTKDGKFEEYSGYSIPHVVIINTKDDSFEIINIETPKDENEYINSIKEMYPLAIRSKVINFDKTKEWKKLLREHEELIKIYRDYSEGE